MTFFTVKEFKSILNVKKYIDNWFWCKYTINTYNGCQIGCIYCDSRSGKYCLPTDFENDIIVKKNPEAMLESRLIKSRTLLKDIVAVGGTTDPYQPAETLYKNTRHCLEILYKHGYPAEVCTKSRLILRDLDLLEDFGKKIWFNAAVTVTTMDPEKARFLEQRAVSPESRFRTIETIKKKAPSVQAGILLMPVIPCLTDSEEDLENVVKRAKESGADYILFGAGMTMRDMQALWFLKHIRAKYPGCIGRYEELYRFKYHPDNYEGTYETESLYSSRLTEMFLGLCRKYAMPYRIRRYIPKDYRRENYLISGKLLDRSYLMQSTGKPWSGLFWAGQNIQNLKEPVSAIAVRGELRKIRNIDTNLENFILRELQAELPQGRR